MEGAGVGVRLFLVGNPVSHSVSPAIYEGVFRELGVRGVYEPVEVSNVEALAAVVEELRGLGDGFNVTIPYKASVLGLLDAVSPEARVIGAVNTVVRSEDGLLEGFNTDWKGFLYSLERVVGASSFSGALVVGAGGAARAAVYALKGRVDSLYVSSRTGVSAVELAREAASWGFERVSGFRANVSVYQSVLPRVDLVVNASPVGLLDPRASPVPTRYLRPGTVVVDMVYRPLRTRLLAGALERGCRVVDGLWMLAFQAVENLRLWLGMDVDVEVVRRYGLRALGGGGV